MRFWTKDEYLRFSHAMMDKPLSYYAFEMLYWCGIREGELLALTPADFDFGKCTVSISKSYQRLHGKDVITTPKTRKSCRTIRMPEFYEMKCRTMSNRSMVSERRIASFPSPRTISITKWSAAQNRQVSNAFGFTI